MNNSKLFDKVKGKCKDMGLSEKYLKDITEALGAALSDDSTDEQIETVANQCVTVAKHSQAEATRWANKNKQKKGGKDGDPDTNGDEDDPDEEGKGKGEKTEPPTDEPEFFRKFREMMENRMDAMEKAEKERKAEDAKAKRKADIVAACDKYKVPEEKRRFVLNIPDDEDIDTYVGDYAKQFTVDNLPGGGSGEKKVPSQKETEETGKGWFARLNPSKK